MRLISHDFARRHLVLSAGREGTVERVLSAGTAPPEVLWNVRTRLGVASIDVESVDAAPLAAAIDRAYSSAQTVRDADEARLLVTQSADPGADMDRLLRETDVLGTEGKAPVMRLVDLLLFEAMQRRASDVHIQPVEDRVLVRYRLDGVLHTVREMPREIAAAMASRVKVMSKLDVAEREAPQDGRMRIRVGRDGQIGADLRVSTFPTTYGERIVIRVLDAARSPHELGFSALGMDEDVRRDFERVLSRDSGIVLVSGPTGSGKSTTLYAALAWVMRVNSSRASGCEFNIMTIEDPVEYNLSTPTLAISQTQVHPKRGLTFAAGIRHILRQDPDVIMVGEIRDEETAKVAVQASLTGHLVLSTLHTNDAPSAAARLVDLAVEPFLVSSSLTAVLAQRLVRKVHSECGGRGCETCMMTGCQGRTGLFELLVVDDVIRDLIERAASSPQIAEAAVRSGMRTLRERGVALAASGVTTLREVDRVLSAHLEVVT
jgi:general secretion pathway protein E